MEFMGFIHWTLSPVDPRLFAICDLACYLIDGAPGSGFFHENHIKVVQWRCAGNLTLTWEMENVVKLIIAKVEIPKKLCPYNNI